MSDEELQKRIEQGDRTEHEDAEVYQMLFDTLKQEPEFRVPPDFADRVVKHVALKKQRSASSEFGWLIFGILIFSGASVLAMSIAGFSFQWNLSIDLGFLSGMSPYAGLLIFGVVFIALLNWVDNKFLRGGRPV